MEVIHQSVMSITRMEFLRLLPAATGCPVIPEEGGSVFRHQAHGKAWMITLEPLPALVAGSLQLERHRVTLSAEGYPADEIRHFLKRFEDHFQRGGG